MYSSHCRLVMVICLSCQFSILLSGSKEIAEKLWSSINRLLQKLNTPSLWTAMSSYNPLLFITVNPWTEDDLRKLLIPCSNCSINRCLDVLLTKVTRIINLTHWTCVAIQVPTGSCYTPQNNDHQISFWHLQKLLPRHPWFISGVWHDRVSYPSRQINWSELAVTSVQLSVHSKINY